MQDDPFTDGRLTVPDLGAGSITFHVNHPVAEDMVLDMLACLPPRLTRDVSVYIGALRFRKLDRTALNIGLQTEHFLDQDGQPMKGMVNPNRLRNTVTRYDHVLDLSPHNAPHYDACGVDRSGVVFGPYLFPETPQTFRPGGTGLLFVGAATSYREAQLARLAAGDGPPITRFEGFRDAVKQAIRGSCAVLNIHTRPGTYSEIPRLLKTYLNGKVAVSEPLSDPLVAGRHYLPLDSDPRTADLQQIYTQFAGFARANSFAGYLRQIGVA